MKKNIQLIPINKIRRHERTRKRRVESLVRAIASSGKLERPIVVERTCFVLLDGHHRLEALRRLGAKRVPAYLVDYQSSRVHVYLRRKYLIMRILKDAVIRSALTGQALPVKTTRHLIHNRPGRQPVALNTLCI